MSPIILLILVAGTVIAVFFFLAALIWGIRTRRGEEDFVPAPKSLKNYNRRETGVSAGSETVQDWLGGTNRESPEAVKAESVPDWLRQPEDGLRGSGEPARNTIGGVPQSPFGDFLRNAVPQLSTVIDLSRLVKQMQATGEWSDAPEERNAALRKALDQMLEQQPHNEILIQMRDSFQSGDESETEIESDDGMQVIQVAGRNVIRIDGIEYYSLADISDPDLRDEARQLLLDLDEQKPS